MIQSKEELRFYLEADKIALNITNGRPSLYGDRIWKFQRCLRALEYVNSQRKGSSLWVFRYYITRLRLDLLTVKTGFQIFPNTCGPGLSLAHEGSVVVHGNARLGENCRMHVGVNIGATGGSTKAPHIGNNVYIAPGAKIFGEITIADGVVIGANAVVNKSVYESNITVGGIPATKISDSGSDQHLIRATEVLREERIMSGRGPAWRKPKLRLS